MWLLMLLAAALSVLYSWWRLQYFARRGVSTLPPIPFFGNLTAVTFGRENFIDVIASGYSAFKDERYFGVYQYHKATVVPRDRELIKRIMVADFAAFADRGVHIPPECDPLVGFDIIMLKGQAWREMRATVAPALSPGRCRAQAPLMAGCARAVAAHLRAASGAGALVHVYTISLAYVNDVITSCAFGLSTDALGGDCGLYRLGRRAMFQSTPEVLKLFGYANAPALMKLLGVRVVSAADTEQFVSLFTAAMAERRAAARPRPDLIQTLVDTPHEYTSEQLVAQAVMFYVAGLDTTANLISYCLYELAGAGAVRARLTAELRAAAESLEKGEDVYDTVQGLEYLEMFVCEVLRLWPLLGSADRRSLVPYDFGPTRPGGKHHFIAPAGTHVWLPIYSLHRDAALWPAPERLDPERFAPAARRRHAPGGYLPFGGGPRHCPGSRFAVLAAKVFLVHVLSEFSVSSPRPAAPRSAPPPRVAPRAFVLRPEESFKLLLEPYNNNDQ